MNVSTAEIERARHAALRALSLFRLPFRRDAWRGSVGNWSGAGVGSSIDFQDHRPYVPGDDPRYIDWQAYARSDHYVMKLYREEVSPSVDLVFDPSLSMAADDAKKRRSLELFYFSVESAVAAGARLRPWIMTRDGAARVDVERIRSGEDVFAAGTDEVDASLLQWVALRPGSLRVLISDCLFPGDPESVISTLAGRKGRAMVLAPTSSAESEPNWRGHMELEDCESTSRRVEFFDDARLARYREAYARHFQMWEERCRRYGFPFVHLPVERELSEALREHALGVAAIEASQ